jgi:hypothetical protein
VGPSYWGQPRTFKFNQQRPDPNRMKSIRFFYVENPKGARRARYREQAGWHPTRILCADFSHDGRVMGNKDRLTDEIAPTSAGLYAYFGFGFGLGGGGGMRGRLGGLPPFFSSGSMILRMISSRVG